MYKSKNHGKFSLKAHLVFSTKYRLKLFDNKRLSFELKANMYEIAKNSNFNIELVETDRDHIHILIDYEPNVSIKQIVRKLKSETQYYMWLKFAPYLKSKYWTKNHKFWSKGYFVCSIGEGASYDTIQEYINNQG